MTRFRIRSELLAHTRAERKRLEQNLASLKPEDFLKPGVNGEWSVKDLLMHLVDWEQRWLGWYTAGCRGETPAVPAPGLTWAQIDTLNHQIFEKYRDLPLDEVLFRFETSFAQFIQLAESFSEEAVFQASLQPWMGRYSPADFIAANGGNHYLWAKTLLRKWLKKRE
jgi:hypothetical protein